MRKAFYAFILFLLLGIIGYYSFSYISDFSEQLLLKSHHMFTLKIIGLIVTGLYCVVFGVMGYDLAKRRKRNALYWSIVCGLTGVWGWAYLYFVKRNYS